MNLYNVNDKVVTPTKEIKIIDRVFISLFRVGSNPSGKSVSYDIGDKRYEEEELKAAPKESL